MNRTTSDNDAVILGFAEYTEPAARLAGQLGIPYHEVDIHKFPDGESRVRLPEKLGGRVVLCRSLDKPNDKLVELLLAADTARRLGARHLTLVAPYLCYMRQDKAFHGGEAISQKIIGSLLAQHFDALVTVDPHLHRVQTLAEVIPGISCLAMTATGPMAGFLSGVFKQPLLLGPDEESQQWVASLADLTSYDYAVASKHRHSDVSVDITLPGIEVRGRDVVLVDDIASSGYTLAKAARLLHKQGVASVSVLVTHGLFAGDALVNLHQAGVQNIWSTDSVPHASNCIRLDLLLAQAVQDLWHGISKR